MIMGNLFLDVYLVFSVIATIASVIWLIVLIRNKPIKRYSVIRDVPKRPKPVRAFGESETRLPFTLNPGESVEFLLDTNPHKKTVDHSGIVDDVLDITPNVRPMSAVDTLMKPYTRIYDSEASEKKTDIDDILERHRRNIANGGYVQDNAVRSKGSKHSGSSGNDDVAYGCDNSSGSSDSGSSE